MQTVLHLTPLADVRLLSQNRKNIEKSKDFVQNQKKPREIEKNQKNQRFWDNVLVSCKHSVGQIVFFVFFFSISRGFFRFWTIARKSLEGFQTPNNKKTKGVASPTTQLQVTASPTESLKQFSVKKFFGTPEQQAKEIEPVLSNRVVPYQRQQQSSFLPFRDELSEEIQMILEESQPQKQKLGQLQGESSR